MRHEIDGGRHRWIVEIEGGRGQIVAQRQHREDGLDRARCPEQVPGRRFGGGHGHLAGGVAEQPLDGGKLDLVAHGRRGAVRIDIVDIGRVDAGPLHRRGHAAEGAVAILGGRGDVEGVAGEPIADNLRVDARAPRLGMLELLDHHHAGALAHDEAVAVAVVRPRGLLRLVVEIRGQRPAGGKARNGKPAHRRFRAPRQHHVRIAESDEPRGIADGMRAGRASGDDRMVRALQPVLDGYVAGGKIDEPARNEEGAHPSRPLVGKQKRGLLDPLEAADPGADQHARANLVLIGSRFPAGIGQRLGRGAHRKDDEVVDLPLLLGLHPIIGIERAVAAIAARDLAGDLAGEIGDVEILDLARGVLSFRQPLPGGLVPAA